jgi:hypothetical protein
MDIIAGSRNGKQRFGTMVRQHVPQRDGDTHCRPIRLLRDKGQHPVSSGAWPVTTANETHLQLVNVRRGRFTEPEPIAHVA